MIRWLLSLAGLVLFLFALAMVVGTSGCTPIVQQSVENAAAVAQYEALLDDCRKQGKAAKDYQVYANCADAVDRRLCAESGVRCVDGGR